MQVRGAPWVPAKRLEQLKNMLAQFGTAFGVASSTLMLQWRATEHYNVLNVRFSPGDPIYQQTLASLTHALASRGAGVRAEHMALAQLAQLLGRESMLMACLDYFGVIVGVVGAVVMFYQRLMR